MNVTEFFTKVKYKESNTSHWRHWIISLRICAPWSNSKCEKARKWRQPIIFLRITFRFGRSAVAIYSTYDFITFGWKNLCHYSRRRSRRRHHIENAFGTEHSVCFVWMLRLTVATKDLVSRFAIPLQMKRNATTTTSKKLTQRYLMNIRLVALAHGTVTFLVVFCIIRALIYSSATLSLTLSPFWLVRISLRAKNTTQIDSLWL